MRARPKATVFKGAPAFASALTVGLLWCGRAAAAEPALGPRAPDPAQLHATTNEGGEALDPQRMEFAGLPIIGGNSDIGLQLGAAVTVTKFKDDNKPYFWNVDAVASTSGKNDQNGFRLVQHAYLLRLDAPSLLGGRVRTDLRASFQRTINDGYYGIGNATPAGNEDTEGRRFQYLHTEARLRGITRIHTSIKPLDLAFAANLRYEVPETYLGSKLAEDGLLHNPDGLTTVPGIREAALGGGSAGVMIDTRDTEFVTQRGIFYQLGVGVTQGTQEKVASGEAAAVLAHYAKLPGPLVFASRMVMSFQFGRPTFYDQQQAGVFEPQYLIGGENGVRGVPRGRYAGAMKMATNNELRVLFPRFRLFGQRLRPGVTALFDVGRVWADYRRDSVRDGTKLGLKYGVGGGIFGQWGEAAIVRVEAAYSPDAVSENPGFPVGIYVSDGLTF